MATCDKEGYLLGIGNPLLDISATVGNDLLDKYDLKANGVIMADEKHMPLYKELVDKYNAEYIAGGSVQNSLRVAQWILKQPKVCTYFGCVGNDDFATKLRERATADGVRVQYQVTKEAPTGTCAVLITGTQRSLCANLAAAQKFTPEHLATADARKSVEMARLFYTSGFFLAVSPESLMQLAKHALAKKHVFAMNLSAPFVAQFFKEPLAALMPYVDVLFGNITEVESFAKAFDIPERDIKAVALKIAAMPKLNGDRKRVVVMTQASDPVILVEGTKAEQMLVTKLRDDQIVDTNGAGDAFAGGFLSQMVLGGPLTSCVKCGMYSATHIIQQSGCTLNGTSNFVDS